MLPDHRDAIEAVVNYIDYKAARRAYAKDKSDRAKFFLSTTSKTGVLKPQ